MRKRNEGDWSSGTILIAKADYIVVTPNGCWIWIGCRKGKGDAYGSTQFRGRSDLAHRAAYTVERGEIPEGMVVDHLCRTPLCVNPDHMEVVTNRRNVLRGVGTSAENSRKTHCVNGHALSGSNVRLTWRRDRRRPSRVCRECKRQSCQRRRDARKAMR